MRKIHFLALLASFTNIYATDYYVDAVNGNDRNTGLSSSKAYKTLKKIDAINFQPGDNVFFMAGTYTRSGQTLLKIGESGTASKPITFKNFNNQKAILEFDSWTGISIVNGGSYLVFDGLNIKGARSKVDPVAASTQPASCGANKIGSAIGLYNGTGILAVGPNLKWSSSETTGNEVPHHITIQNCEVYDCTSSGIAFQQADYATIKNNKIYNNCWYTIYGTSGINLYQFINTDNTTGFHNEVSNNLLYSNKLVVPQVPYCAFYDGNALIIDDFKHEQKQNYKNQNTTYQSYTAKTLVKNNISVENGGSGLHFFLSTNCYIFNNTVVNNATQNNGDNGNGQLRVGSCDNFVIKNNIFKSPLKIHAIESNTNVDYTNNYQYGSGIDASLVGCQNCIENTDLTFSNTNISSSSPYITSSTSPIKDKGVMVENVTTDYLSNGRPSGAAFDIGAYELINNNSSRSMNTSELVDIEYENSYIIYPTLFNGSDLNLEINSNNKTTANIEVIDLSGRIVAFKDLGTINGGKTFFKLNDIGQKINNSGIYLAKITIDNKVSISKIIRD